MPIRKGDAAPSLARRTVILTRQFRYPAFVNGCDDLLIETPAGLLDDASPEERIRAETEEETGFRVRDVRQVFEAYMSPGSVTEKLFFFVGTYQPADRIGKGGGHAAEGEDIDMLELGIDDALAMIGTGASATARPSCSCSTPPCICSIEPIPEPRR